MNAATALRRLLPEARRGAVATGVRLIETLEERSALDAEAFVAALAELTGMAAMDAAGLRQTRPRFDLIPFVEAMQRRCVALEADDAGLVVITDDPFDSRQRPWAEDWLKAPFAWRLVHRGDLAAFLAGHEQDMQALDSMPHDRAVRSDDASLVEDLSLGSIGGEASEIVRLVRSTLHDALRFGASDVHFETGPDGLTIKFRIDGMLTQVKSVPDPVQAEQAISRVKVLADLDITERRIPQDGRFKAADRGRAIDFRVSIMPSIFGEDAVVRILDKQSLQGEGRALRLDGLGFEEADVRTIRRFSVEPYGMFLVTGPTGSGKTTTLYAALSEINTGHDKIITIEDPVEYQLPGVLQIPVNEKKGLTFAVGLRSILRHDPDTIMVGEIRDPETAAIAVQSALTGHLVFTTVHANNVFDVIGRFVHMQVDLYSFVSALNGILAQRLIRLNCPHCSADETPPDALLSASGLDAAAVSGYRFRRGGGCREGRGTGFRGRRAIAEVLLMGDEIRELIAQRAPIRSIKTAARAKGTRSLREAALAAVARGQTTLQEINRVTFVE